MGNDLRHYGDIWVQYNNKNNIDKRTYFHIGDTLNNMDEYMNGCGTNGLLSQPTIHCMPCDKSLALINAIKNG